jgi:hypothetical protein
MRRRFALGHKIPDGDHDSLLGHPGTGFISCKARGRPASHYMDVQSDSCFQNDIAMRGKPLALTPIEPRVRYVPRYLC